jgi:alpha-glucosidase
MIMLQMRMGIGILLGVVSMVTAQNAWEVSSPQGNLTMSVNLVDRGGTADYLPGVRLYYSVQCKVGDKSVAVLNDSPLGMVRDDQAFVEGLAFVSASKIQKVEQSYALPHGKKSQYSNACNEQTIVFQNGRSAKMELIVRVFDNGAAFRYRFPEKDAAVHKLTQEATGYAIPKDARCWMMPSDAPTQYAPAYEVYYESDIAVGTLCPKEFGWAFPALFSVEGGKCWALLAEADMDRNYFGARLESKAPKGVYRIRMPEAEEGMGVGSIQPSSALPWQTPWRVVIAGELSTVVESTLITDLARPTEVKDISWVKPGRVSWSWWSDQDSPQNCTSLKKFVDLAAEMGWEYTLVDANWTIMKNGTIHDLMQYAADKKVGVLLWYNSGGPHNRVTEMPRGMMDMPSVRRFEFERLKKWGVKGVKVDFFQSDKQESMALYQGILADAADFQIMVNFHGCTIPRGWSRTWPNLVSMEGVRGEECYIFDPAYPDKAPSYNTILAFTRNVIGPMDYTPVGFSNNRYPHKTSNTHELALSVVFESGWLHFTDSVESYRAQPEFVKTFMKAVPTAWDDTRLIDGMPGSHAVLARRKGDGWFVAGINGLDKPRTVTLDPAVLGKGSWKLDLITDGDNPKSLAHSDPRALASGDKVTIPLGVYGGFVARLSPATP